MGEDILAHRELGIKKYGTTLADNKLSLKEALIHAYEESLDKSLYLRKAIEILKEQEKSE